MPSVPLPARLSELKARRPEKIAAISVLCRPDKRVGRGLKLIREVPIKAVANELGIKLHQVDTFTGWTPPASINLIVAVSFGLLVPSRILTAAKYGGLNVHPSMLPDLRGPAPVVHTLLKQRKYTGVTLQTMHPTKFDQGDILAQTASPGIPVPPDSTADALLDVLGRSGAEMLSCGIEQGLFVLPLRKIDSHPESDHVEYAPKITSEDRHIDWATWSADDIVLRDKVLGRLWDMRIQDATGESESGLVNSKDSISQRVVFQGPWQKLNDKYMLFRRDASPREGNLVKNSESDDGIGFLTCDGWVVAPYSATIDGHKKGLGLKSMLSRLLSERERR